MIAEYGWATAALPDRVQWTAPDGKHGHVPPRQRPLGQLLLERFFDAVKTGQPPEPSLEEAHRVLTWLRAAAASRAEGRRVEL